MRIGSFGEIRRRGRAYGPLPIIGGGGTGGLRPQDVFAVLTQPANTMQAAINALPFPPDALIDKDRAAATDWSWRSALRGLSNTTASNTTAAETAFAGYSGTNNRVVYASKKAAKFYTEVVYTGDGTNNRAIAHDLGIAPGMIVVKRLDGVASWACYHKSLGATKYLYLDATDTAGTSAAVWANTEPTSSAFTLGAAFNASGGTYLARLWAHDPDTTNGIIQCVAATSDASGNATVTLGWQPQFLVTKATSTTGDWLVLDAARGWTASAGSGLFWSSSQAEVAFGNSVRPTTTGFTLNGAAASTTYVFLAIRAPV